MKRLLLGFVTLAVLSALLLWAGMTVRDAKAGDGDSVCTRTPSCSGTMTFDNFETPTCDDDSCPSCWVPNKSTCIQSRYKCTNPPSPPSYTLTWGEQCNEDTFPHVEVCPCFRAPDEIDDEEECESQGYYWNSFTSPSCRSEPVTSGCEPADWGFWHHSFECQYWYTNCQCLTDTPIVLDVAGNGFNLTSPENGVPFDLNVDGAREQHAWTAAGSDDSFLALDRNGNGTIDDGSELFGNLTAQPEPPAGVKKNGFLALASLDQNSDGRIDNLDSVYLSLRVWQDANHDGISQPGELRTMPAAGLRAVDTNYKEVKRQDQHGNGFSFRAKLYDLRGAQAGRWAWDVYLR